MRQMSAIVAHPVAADAAAVIVLVVQQRRGRRRPFRWRQAQAKRQRRWSHRRGPVRTTAFSG